MRIATDISFVVMVPMLIGGVWATTDFYGRSDVPTSTMASRPAMTAGARAPASQSSTLQEDDPLDLEGTDLYGNEITDAVARYSLDADGSLYEQHSPRTELPRLGSPKS